MQQRRALDEPLINRELLRGALETPGWWKYAVASLAFLVVTGLVVFGFQINRGLGVTGLSRPVFWGAYITTFVFWVGISHAGIMISAILRLTQAEWRRPVTRAAELLTVFSLLAALSFPIIHAGRPWRIIYWIVPYDFARGVWPSRLPLGVAAPAFIGLFSTVSSLHLSPPEAGSVADPSATHTNTETQPEPQTSA